MNATHSPEVMAPRSSDPKAITHFLAPCPICGTTQKFVPELLFRSLMTNDVKNYASELPKFLLRDEEKLGKDPREEDRVHGFFASVCSSPACQVPIFLRVEAKKIEFMKIMRARAGRPHCQTEADLRPSELELIATYPKSIEHDHTPAWCDQELGALCETLVEFEPSRLSRLSDASFRSSAQNVIEQMLLRLEAKRLFAEEIKLMFKRRSFWFRLGDQLRNLLNGIRPHKEIRGFAKAYADSDVFGSAEAAVDFVLVDYRLLGAAVSKYDINDARIQKLNLALDKGVDAARQHLGEQQQDKRIMFRSIPQRLKALHEAGFVPREIWRWACRIAEDAQARTNAGFCAKVKKAELAVFVRSFAARSFQHPWESVQQMRTQIEDRSVSVMPIKAPKRA